MNNNNNELVEAFIHESDLERLNRAVEMFTHCVRAVEEKIDECGDYVEPTVSMDSYFEKKDIADEDIYIKVSQFFDAIREWMEDNDMNHDYDYSPDDVVRYISKYLDDVVSSGWWDMGGCIGIRIPIGVAVAFLHYVAPEAFLEIDYAHDKWEYRGDYSTEKRVCLRLKRYDEPIEIDYNHYEAYDM